MRLVCRFIPLLFFVFAVVAGSAVSSYAAPKKTDAQIDEQKNALKKLEVDLAKKREELAVLETILAVVEICAAVRICAAIFDAGQWHTATLTELR